MSFRFLFLFGHLVAPVAAIAGLGGAVPVNGTMVYTQNFDSLGLGSGSWVDDFTLPGWYAQINDGATPSGILQVSDGTQSLNGLLNLGTTGHLDRALGSRAASAGNNANIALGVQFVNSGTAPLKVSRFTYTGELWRSNSSSGGRAETWTVYYARQSSLLTDLESGVNSPTPSPGMPAYQFSSLVPAANWTSTNNLPRETSRDGNNPANRVTISVVPDLPYFYPGQYLTFKWTDTNLAGNDGYQALDDVSVEFTSLENVPGLPDGTFQSDVNDRVYAVAPQPDGKVVIGGFFSSISGQPRAKIARLQSNGLPDSGFTSGLNGTVYCTAALPDGSVIAGRSNSIGSDSDNAVRYHANGTRDHTFAPWAPAEVAAILPEVDGKILLGGHFSRLGDIYCGYIGRIDGAGQLAPDFIPGADWHVYTLATGPDGKVIAGGAFEKIAGIPRPHLARLHADGKLDRGFFTDSNDAVLCVALQADGKYVIGGAFTAINGVARSRLARVNDDGTLDQAFNPGADDSIYSIVMQADGRMLVGGGFTTIAGAQRRYLARLNNDGTLDVGFDAGFSPELSNHVTGISLQPDGKVLVCGRFGYISDLARPNFVRLSNDPATQSLAAELPNRVEWLRGGSSPEVEQVRFELSSDQGGRRTPLGPGTRIAGGWELMNAGILPESGLVRARARSAGGFRNGSSGLIETTAAYVTSSRQRWRFTYFGIYSNTGEAADHADPDQDGLENLIEYAFALNPLTPDAAALPEWQVEDNEYVLNFSRPEGVDSVTYTAEYSATLAPGSWLPALNAVSPPHYAFYTPASGQRLYVRVRVTSP